MLNPTSKVSFFFFNRKYVHYRNNQNKAPKQLGAYAQSHVQMHSNCTSLTQKEQVPIYSTWSSSPTELPLFGSAPGPDLGPYAPSFTNRSGFAERLHGAPAARSDPRSPGRARCLFPRRGSSLHIQMLLLNASTKGVSSEQKKNPLITNTVKKKEQA